MLCQVKNTQIKKGKHYLIDKDGKMCCLGVFADIKGELPKNDQYIQFIGGNPEYFVPEEWGINIELQSELANINDGSDTFAPVIDKLKEFL